MHIAAWSCPVEVGETDGGALCPAVLVGLRFLLHLHDVPWGACDLNSDRGAGGEVLCLVDVTEGSVAETAEDFVLSVEEGGADADFVGGGCGGGGGGGVVVVQSFCSNLSLHRVGRDGSVVVGCMRGHRRREMGLRRGRGSDTHSGGSQRSVCSHCFALLKKGGKEREETVESLCPEGKQGTQKKVWGWGGGGGGGVGGGCAAMPVRGVGVWGCIWKCIWK